MDATRSYVLAATLQAVTNVDRITGYGHFCTTPFCDHQSCGKCTLYHNTEEDDRRARHEAGIREYRNAAAENVGLLHSPNRQPRNVEWVRTVADDGKVLWVQREVAAVDLRHFV